VASVLLVDTYSLFFRAFYALPPMTTTAGEPTSAIYGFSVLLLKVLREQRPTGVAFAVDAPERTFRHHSYADYKAHRARVPDALGAQFVRLGQLLDALGLPVFSAPGFEADDVIATLAKSLSAEGTPSLVISGDRDLFQVIDAHVHVLFVGARGRDPTLYDVGAVERRFQVEPKQLPSWVALVGDPSDNLPGVPGIGPRTASALIRRFGSTSKLLDNLAEVSPVKIRESLFAHAGQIRLNEGLARLRTDVPLGERPAAGVLSSSSFSRVRDLFVALEFKSLLARLDSLEKTLLGPRKSP
jgi:DNA polymerase-1